MSPKLFEPTFDPPPRMSPLQAVLVWLFVLVLLFVVATHRAPAGERISFSINAAEPVSVQAAGSGASRRVREAVPFSIHASEQPPPTTTNPIAFSVHDATALEGNLPKPDCSPARTVNRVLVIYPPTTTVRVKVCDEFGCRYELRTVPHPILGELKKLGPKWSAGDKDCDHFRLVNADDPKQADLIRELDVKRDELPLLVKETDVEKRKKAAGMSGEEIAKLWNKWFLEPKAEDPAGQRAETEKCLPTFGSSGEVWTYPGNIRHHLTDPRSPHHLPAAVVAAWTDQQCVAWHNWHHEVLSGRKKVPSTEYRVPSGTQARTSASVRAHLETRIASIAQATIRLPPPQMVAAANASDGHSSDAKRAKKKPNTLSRNGSLMSVAA